MKRAEIMAVARTQESDARCINPWRGMARRGKRLGAKKVRQHLLKELCERRTDERSDFGEYTGQERSHLP
jgi:hypothetical protein